MMSAMSEPSLYPDGYRDPEWDGTVADFADKVLPARVAALDRGINERFADIFPEGMRWERVTRDGSDPS